MFTFAAAAFAAGALCAACEAGPASPEDVATTASALAITGLYPTGSNGAGGVAAMGSTDAHWTLSSDDPAFKGPKAIVATVAGGWAADTATSRWISVQQSAAGNTGNTYTYTTHFTLVGTSTTSATLTGQWACDDSCTMLLNGKSVATNPTPAWGTVATFTVPAGSPFVTGDNTLAIATVNTTGGPTGLQVVSISGTVNACDVDADCTATQFCNTPTNTCTTKLANGTTIPTIAGHTPALMGTCTNAVGTAVCASGVCDTTNSECGYAAGDGSCTKVNAGTVCQTKTCSLNGKCEPAGGCNLDTDCPVGDWCDESAHTCNARLANGTAMPSDADHTVPILNGKCTATAAALVCASGVCDPNDDLNECGIANGDGPCTIATPGVCRSGSCSLTLTCKPSNQCNRDGDCTGGDWCNEAKHTCEAKLPNGTAMPSDPTHTNPTLTGTCPSLASNAAAKLVCASGVCDTADNKCGYASGDGTCTLGDAGDGTTVCRSGICVTSGASEVCGPAPPCTMDDQCATGFWCDVSAKLCSPKLPDGAGLPSDPDHTNPTLNGMCSTGVGALVCESGYCSATTSECEAVPSADAGTGDAGTGSGSDAGGAGGDAGPTSGDAGAIGDGGEDASSGAGEDGGADAALEDGATGSGSEDATTGSSGSSGNNGDGSAGTADDTGVLEGGGLSCSLSRGPAPASGGLEIAVGMLALGATLRRGRRSR